ncbi:MAG: hypothetical protein KBT33_06510 [Prevotellaceae bacterium]|nr:hypothetical protein [Candidatus Minthosoma equi]
MRKFENVNARNEASVKMSLNMLADKNTKVEDYRKAFDNLGRELGVLLASDSADVAADEIMLVCASEDADWLAKGVENGLGKGKTPLSVFWSTRSVVYNDEGEKLEISPIVKSYEEPVKNCRLLIVVKSIISSSCVVKTQLTRLMGKFNPERIVILAPVMYKDGMPNLMKEFPKAVSNRFEFLTFAVDEDRTPAGEVIPGIGGMVYPRLGLGDMNAKNSYIPQMVLERL